MSIRTKMMINACLFALVALYLIGFEMTYILKDYYAR